MSGQDRLAAPTDRAADCLSDGFRGALSPVQKVLLHPEPVAFHRHARLLFSPSALLGWPQAQRQAQQD